MTHKTAEATGYGDRAVRRIVSEKSALNGAAFSSGTRLIGRKFILTRKLCNTLYTVVLWPSNSIIHYLPLFTYPMFLQSPFALQLQHNNMAWLPIVPINCMCIITHFRIPRGWRHARTDVWRNPVRGFAGA